MTELDREDWTYGAKSLVQWATNVNSKQPILLMLRHSHRETLLTYEDTMGGGLTDLGKRVSLELGRRLPLTRQAHIFLSVVPRCFQTAEAIAEGFSAEGGDVLDMDPLPTLIGPEYTDRSVWNNLDPNGGNVTEFVNSWSNNEFEGIEPFDKFSVRLMGDTVRRLQAVEDNLMHIHITHDLAMMCTKRILFDRPLTREDRVPFLGGLGITLKNDVLTLFVGGNSEPIEIPKF